MSRMWEPNEEHSQEEELVVTDRRDESDPRVEEGFEEESAEEDAVAASLRCRAGVL